MTYSDERVQELIRDAQRFALDAAAAIADKHKGHHPLSDRIGDKPVSCTFAIAVEIRQLKIDVEQLQTQLVEPPAELERLGTPPASSEVISLMDALKKSLAKGK